MAEESLRHLSADILFLGVDGIDVRHGLSTPNLLEAAVNRAMVEAAKRTVATCDSSKFGRRSLAHIVSIGAIQEVITDKGAPNSDMQTLRKTGVIVTLV
jgi:DeoR family transcriptional regulator of aga operon